MKVHPKYMIVLPKEIRRALGVRVGDKLDIKLMHRKAEISPLRTASPEAVKRTFGMFKVSKDVDIDAVIGRAEMFLAEDLGGVKRGEKGLH